MLTGVDEDLLEFIRIPGHLVDDRRHFHEVGPRAHDVQDTFQGFTRLAGKETSGSPLLAAGRG